MHYKQLRRRVNVNNNFVPHNKILTMISAAMDAIKKFGIINKRQKSAANSSTCTCTCNDMRDPIIISQVVAAWELPLSAAAETSIFTVNYLWGHHSASAWRCKTGL